MKLSILLQIALLLAILGLVYVVVETVQQPPVTERRLGLGQVPTPPTTVVDDEETTGTVDGDTGTTGAAAVARRGRFFNLGESTMFRTIIKTPTPTPRKTRPPRTPTPPPNLDQVLKAAGWQLRTVFRGKAMIEQLKEKDPSARWLTLQVGDTHDIQYGRQAITVEMVSMDSKAQSCVLKFGNQTTELKAFE